MADAFDPGPLEFGAAATIDELARPAPRIEVLRALEDGDHLFLHTVRHCPEAGEPWVMMELISSGAQLAGIGAPPPGLGRRFVGSPIRVTGNPDSTMTAGPRKVRDLARTRSNKALVRQFARDVLAAGRLDLLGECLDRDRFLSHNPRIRGRFEDFEALLRKEMSAERPLRYLHCDRFVGQGDFTAVFSRISFDGGLYAACDLFRLENGLIVEHWDVAEPMPHHVGDGLNGEAFSFRRAP